MAKTIVTVSLDKELARQLNHVAQETARQRSWLVSQAIQDFLEDIEDVELAYTRFTHPKEGRLSERRLRKKLGLSR